MNTPRGSHTDRNYQNDTVNQEEVSENIKKQTEKSDESVEALKQIRKLNQEMLKKSDARAIDANTAVKTVLADVKSYFDNAEIKTSKDGEKLVDEISTIFEKVSDKDKDKLSQFDLTIMKDRLTDISKMINKSGNIQGEESERLQDLVNITEERISIDRGKNAAYRALSDSAKYLADNALDISAITSGLLTNSPLVTFATKMVGDIGKGLMNKRKEVREERARILAEKSYELSEEQVKQQTILNEIQEKERKDNLDAEKKPKDEKPKVVVLEEEVTKVDVVRMPDSPGSVEQLSVVRVDDSDGPDLPENIIPDEESVSQAPDPVMVTIDESESDSEILNIDPMVEEQKKTNTILDKYVNFMFYNAADDEEEKRESIAREEKRIRLLGRDDDDGEGIIEKKGFMSKIFGLFGGIEAIPGMAMLIGLPAVIGGFITGTLIPAITAFVSGLSAMIIPVMAATAIVTSIVSMLDGFFNAEDKLGKMDVSIVERFAAAIGGIMEGFGSIVDFVAGIFGFDTDYEKWWNENFTRPLAEFMENFSLSAIMSDTFDWLAGIPDQMLESTKAGMQMLWDYNPINMMLKGYKWLADQLGITEWLVEKGEQVFETIKELNPMDDIVDFFQGIASWVDDTFNISDNIADIMESLNIVEMFEKIKTAVFKYIPDFMLSDENKEIKKSLDPTKIEESKKADADNFVKDVLTKEGVVNYNRVGTSDVTDWDAVEQMPKSAVDSMIEFDDWDDDTKNRLISLSTAIEGNDIQTPSTAIEGNDIQTPEQRHERMVRNVVGDNYDDFKNSGKSLGDYAIEMNEPPALSPIMAETTDQPLIKQKLDQTSNIRLYNELIDDHKEKKQEVIIPPTQKQNTQVNQSTTYNVPAIPYNQEKGIRDLQQTFAV